MRTIEIRVKGCIDEHWSAWLAGLNITHTDEDETVLSGRVVDQAALYGLLKRVRDTGLTLVAVHQIPSKQEQA